MFGREGDERIKTALPSMPAVPASSSRLSPAMATILRCSHSDEASSYPSLNKQLVAWTNMRGNIDLFYISLLKEWPAATETIEAFRKEIEAKEKTGGYSFICFRDCVSQVIKDVIKRNQSTGARLIAEEMTSEKLSETYRQRELINHEKNIAKAIHGAVNLVKRQRSDPGELKQCLLSSLEKELKET